jgi:hypothetical protein
MEPTPKPNPADELKIPTTLHQAVMPEAMRTGHVFKQRGHVAHCTTCDEPHGFNLGPDQQLTGHDANGYPIISTISVKQAVEVDPKPKRGRGNSATTGR